MGDFIKFSSYAFIHLAKVAHVQAHQPKSLWPQHLGKEWASLKRSDLGVVSYNK